MNKSQFIIFSVLLIVLLPFAYGGCFVVFSSGDNDLHRMDDDQYPSGAYVGITSEVTINAENAVPLTLGALAGGFLSDDSRRSDRAQDDGHWPKANFRSLQFPLSLANALRRIELSPELIILSQSDFIIENDRLEGSCGGSFSYALRLNRQTEKFSGSLAFEKYCTNGIAISGKTDVAGAFQPGSGIFVSAAFVFENLSDGASGMDGEITIDFSDSPLLATFNAYSTDAHHGQVYWIKDYSLNLFEFAGHVEIDIFGTFCHPDHGYVTLTTSDPLVVHTDERWPASGQLIVYGDHNTRARLTALDHLRYGIEADSVGDGIFDWDSGIRSWNDASSG